MGGQVDDKSVEFYMGEITASLKGLAVEQERIANEQGNIYTRINNQNGQIRRLAETVAENTEVVRGNQREVDSLCEWKDGHEREHRDGLKTRVQNGIKLWQAIIAGVIVAAISAGITLGVTL